MGGFPRFLSELAWISAAFLGGLIFKLSWYYRGSSSNAGNQSRVADLDKDPQKCSSFAISSTTTMKQGGDDLDDDFIPDETVALSGDEEPSAALLEDEDVFAGDDNEEDEEPSPTTNPTESDVAANKKRKRKEKVKERKAKKRKLAESVPPVDSPTGTQTPQEMSDYLMSMQVKTFPRYSALELDDIRIPAMSIVDTTSWTGPRTLDQLVNFIIKALPSLHRRLSQRSKSKGAPTLLYIAGAALRVADVTRILKDDKLRGTKGGDVAKLFAKHIKLSEHVQSLKKTYIGTAVGTPGRLGKLLNKTDALNISALSHIMLDITYKDAKNRNLLEIPETRDEVFKTVLNNSEVMDGIRGGKINVVLF